MATSLCFGLMMSTVLVLFLIPTLYYVYALMSGGGAHAVRDEDGPQPSGPDELWDAQDESPDDREAEPHGPSVRPTPSRQRRPRRLGGRRLSLPTAPTHERLIV